MASTRRYYNDSYARSYPTALDPRRKTRRAHRHPVRKFVLIFFAFIVIVGASCAFAANQILSPFSDRIFEGVYVDDISLANLTPQDAYTKISTEAERRLNKWSMRLHYDNNDDWEITPKSLEMRIDAAEQINKAFLQGRTGSLIERCLAIWKLRSDPYNGYTSFYYNEFSLDTFLSQIKSTIDTEAVDAARLPDPNRTPPYRYTDEQTGLSLDTDSIRDEILSRINNLDTSTFVLVPEVVQASITKADLTNDNARLSRAATRISTTSTPERTANVALGCERFNGLVVKPGQTISFNDIAGKRTIENGYQEALEIQYGQYVMGVGGGICQVSSTLYNAVIEAGLEVVDRAAHALPVSYLDPGRDATVADRGTDFVFTNNTDRNITIAAHVEKINKTDHCVFEIYGHPNASGYTYRFVSEILEKIPIPEPKYVPDRRGEYVTYIGQSKQTSKGACGYISNTFRITELNGKEIARDFITQDTYKAQPPLIYTGVNPRN